MGETYKAVPKKDLLIIQGDWNTKVGPHAYTQWAVTVGRYGYGNTNERGWRLLEFANNYRMTLANTLYPHKKSHAESLGIHQMGKHITRLTTS